MLEQIVRKFDTIMIVDDNTIDLYISARIITQNNFALTVLKYSSAIEALKYLTKNQNEINFVPKILFLDVYMPEMSGFDFMSTYNQLSKKLKDKCSVYIISSTNNEKDIAQVKADKNIVAFHEKPLTKEFLESIV